MDWNIGLKSLTKFLFESVQTEIKGSLASCPGAVGDFLPVRRSARGSLFPSRVEVRVSVTPYVYVFRFPL